MSRWSKRYDVKVVPRRYLHLYRCFGWTPTTPTAIPQYDWERRGPNNAAAYTSADISANLQEYDDLGLQRKELVAIQRNTKFYQYKKTYRKFFKDEKQFNKLMSMYTVSNGGKRHGLRQSFNVMKRIIDAFLALFCLALFVGLVLPATKDTIRGYVLDPANTAYLFCAFTAIFLIWGLRKLSFGQKYLYYAVTDDSEDFVAHRHKKRIVVSFRNWEFVVLAAGTAFFALLAFKVFSIEKITDEIIQSVVGRTFAFYIVIGFIYHTAAIFTYNPYAWIKALCLQARPVTKRILMNDISMMTHQQRQKYNQGRIISAAVNDALDKRSRGIKEDFYIGY